MGQSSARPIKVIGLVASPNREGRTQDAVRQALAAAAEAGAATELSYLDEYSSPPCRDCHPWTCRMTHRCAYDSDGRFGALARKVLGADGVVFGSPVYYGIATEFFYDFAQKMHRTQANLSSGVPALGIAVAGGTGGGLVSGLRPIYQHFQAMGMRALEPIPATRFNWPWVLGRARMLGKLVALTAREGKRPFEGLERLAWYDDLPYLGMDRVQERVYLTSVVVEAVAGTGYARAAEASRDFVEACELLGSGDRAAALPLIESAYGAAVEAFEAQA
jgi:NAD(P)H-dependent FMN reductase